MNLPPNRRAALAALGAARPLVASLDFSRDPEELAADIIELWSVVETALRSLAGGSALAGRALVTNLRQREIISLDQTHALLELLDTRERLDRTDYSPTAQDLDAARAAYHALETGLATSAPTAAAPSAAPTGPTGTPLADAFPEPDVVAPPNLWLRRNARWVAVAAAAAVIIVSVLLFVFLGGTARSVRRGVNAYRAGDYAGAQATFAQVAHDHPDNTLAHVYLARLARERHDMETARRELELAARDGANDALVKREAGAYFLTLGQNFLATGRPDLAQQQFDNARRYYVDAVRLDPEDLSAQGYLGCALIRLGRPAEGMQWIQRAGPGGWSACAPQGALPPAPVPGP
ncbi:MAG TPA: tetratricopeptide repeat protein [Gemmatimonadaceae bacterium]|nr:tetratricopeptide repeat protein [Gemmatimonadaceae bacterium]